jgi:hypothetical protein
MNPTDDAHEDGPFYMEKDCMTDANKPVSDEAFQKWERATSFSQLTTYNTFMSGFEFGCRAAEAKAQAKLTQMQTKLDEAVKALEFYAAESSWQFHGRGLALNWVTQIIDDSSRFNERDEVGGHRAREALAKIKGTT